MTQSKLEIHIDKFIKAPPMEVWRHLTDPEKFFATFVGVKFPDGFATRKLARVESCEEQGFVYCEEATPGKRLAFRWNYDVELAKTFSREQSTLVEFLLIEQDGGTLLKFSETEFENLPEDIRQKSFDQVNYGWPTMFDNFRDMVPRGEDAWLVAQWYGLIPAPVEEVWEFVSNFRIFSELVKFEGEVKPGSTVMLDFGQYGKGPALITKAEPNVELAFRSYPSPNEDTTVDQERSTLTQFMMMPMEGGTWFIARESEFDRIPAQGRRETFKGQQEGWNLCGAHIEKSFRKEEK